jgi:hypothetical protein
MKKWYCVACLACLVTLVSTAADADCGFNKPARAKGVKTSLVRAHAPCNGGYTFPFPNSMTSTGVPACSPPAPITDADADGCALNDCTFSASTYNFAADGRCTVTITASTTDECGDAPDAPPVCFALPAKVVCEGIRDDEDKPAHTKVFGLRVVARITTDDGSALTLYDFPLISGTLHVAGGKIADTRELWSGMGNPLSPTCTQVQILRLELLDDFGMVFAASGSARR